MFSNLQVFNEDDQGDWNPTIYDGGGWIYNGAWFRNDTLAGEIAIGLLLLSQQDGATEYIVLSRRSNPDAPQLWHR